MGAFINDSLVDETVEMRQREVSETEEKLRRACVQREEASG